MYTCIYVCVCVCTYMCVCVCIYITNRGSRLRSFIETWVICDAVRDMTQFLESFILICDMSHLYVWHDSDLDDAEGTDSVRDMEPIQFVTWLPPVCITFVCVYVCIYIHVIHTYMYIFTYIHTYKHTDIHTYVHTYMQICIQIVRDREPTYFVTWLLPVCIIFVHVHVFIYTYMYIHCRLSL